VRLLAIGVERAHARSFIIRPVRVIHLEIQRVVCYYGEDCAIEVEASSAEHLSDGDWPQAVQLIHHIDYVTIVHRHIYRAVGWAVPTIPLIYQAGDSALP